MGGKFQIVDVDLEMGQNVRYRWPEPPENEFTARGVVIMWDSENGYRVRLENGMELWAAREDFVKEGPPPGEG